MKEDNHEEDTKVFVYGTLRRGQPCELESTHGRGETCEYRGRATIPGRIYSLSDNFPALVEGEDGTVVGEVYRISNRVLERLDAYEGYPHFYQRKCYHTVHGEAWAYYMGTLPQHGATHIYSGDWCTYIKEVRDDRSN